MSPEDRVVFFAMARNLPSLSGTPIDYAPELDVNPVPTVFHTPLTLR
jgi:hypothetical protein